MIVHIRRCIYSIHAWIHKCLISIYIWYMYVCTYIYIYIYVYCIYIYMCVYVCAYTGGPTFRSGGKLGSSEHLGNLCRLWVAAKVRSNRTDKKPPVLRWARYIKYFKSNWSLVGGLEHEIFDFPYIGNNNSNWRTHIFQRGRSTTNQFLSSN